MFESVRKELCQIFSCETKEKPQTLNDILFEMITEEVDGLQTICCLIPLQRKKKKKKTMQNKLSTSVKPSSTISSCSHNHSLTSAKHPEQSSAATLPSSDLKDKGTRSSLNRETKKKGDHFQKILQETLWQERCVVKESEIQNKLTKEELLLQEVLELQQKGLQYFLNVYILLTSDFIFNMISLCFYLCVYVCVCTPLSVLTLDYL